MYIIASNKQLTYHHCLQVNPHTHQVKLCDFGSAKVLVSTIFPPPRINISLGLELCNVTSFGSTCRSKESQTFHIYVRGTIVLLNSYSVQQNTLLPLTSGLLDVSWLNYCLDRLVTQLLFSFNCFLDEVLNLLKKCSIYFSPFSLVKVELISLLKSLR